MAPSVQRHVSAKVQATSGYRTSTIPEVKSGPTVLIMAAGEGTRMHSSVPKMLHPVCGRLSDRWGARRTTMLGLVMMACVIPPLGLAWSYPSALVLFVIVAATGAFVMTPSLAFIGEATSDAGVRSTPHDRGESRRCSQTR